MLPSLTPALRVVIDPYNSKAMQKTSTAKSNDARSDKDFESLLRMHTTKTPPSQDAKIEKSAKDFESLLLTNWLQQAQQSFATVPGGGEEDTDPGKEQLQGLAMQSLGTALTASGGLGIAGAIAKLLHKKSDTSALNSQQSVPVLGSSR